MNDNKQQEIADNFHNLLFGVRKSVRYHTRRRLFYDRFSKISDALTVIFGSATIASQLSAHQKISTAMAALTAIAGGINLVFGTSKMARDHHDLSRP